MHSRTTHSFSVLVFKDSSLEAVGLAHRRLSRLVAFIVASKGVLHPEELKQNEKRGQRRLTATETKRKRIEVNARMA